MTDPAAQPPAAVPLSEENIALALIDSGGDIFRAADMLGHVPITRLDRAIRASDDLQRVMLTCKQVAALREYDDLTAKQVRDEIGRRLEMYRSDALDALHELACMPVSDNSAQNQVKLLAAQRLAGSSETARGPDDVALVLRQLNDEYHRVAPRIKSVRERVVEFDTEEPPPREPLPPAD